MDFHLSSPSSSFCFSVPLHLFGLAIFSYKLEMDGSFHLCEYSSFLSYFLFLLTDLFYSCPLHLLFHHGEAPVYAPCSLVSRDPEFTILYLLIPSPIPPSFSIMIGWIFPPLYFFLSSALYLFHFPILSVPLWLPLLLSALFLVPRASLLRVLLLRLAVLRTPLDYQSCITRAPADLLVRRRRTIAHSSIIWQFLDFPSVFLAPLLSCPPSSRRDGSGEDSSLPINSGCYY